MVRRAQQILDDSWNGIFRFDPYRHPIVRQKVPASHDAVSKLPIRYHSLTNNPVILPVRY